MLPAEAARVTAGNLLAGQILAQALYSQHQQEVDSIGPAHVQVAVAICKDMQEIHLAGALAQGKGIPNSTVTQVK